MVFWDFEKVLTILKPQIKMVLNFMKLQNGRFFDCQIQDLTYLEFTVTIGVIQIGYGNGSINF